MSAIASGLSGPTASNPTTTDNGFGQLDSDEFLEIILTELSNQDPLAPNDTQALLEQISSLRNIESQTSLQESLETLVSANSLAQAGALIGKLIEGTATNGDQVEGEVTSVRVVEGDAVLQLDTGRRVNLDAVSLITSNEG